MGSLVIEGGVCDGRGGGRVGCVNTGMSDGLKFSASNFRDTFSLGVRQEMRSEREKQFFSLKITKVLGRKSLEKQSIVPMTTSPWQCFWGHWGHEFPVIRTGHTCLEKNVISILYWWAGWLILKHKLSDYDFFLFLLL